AAPVPRARSVPSGPVVRVRAVRTAWIGGGDCLRRRRTFRGGLYHFRFAHSRGRVRRHRASLYRGAVSRLGGVHWTERAAQKGAVAITENGRPSGGRFLFHEASGLQG